MLNFVDVSSSWIKYFQISDTSCCVTCCRFILVYCSVDMTCGIAVLVPRSSISVPGKFLVVYASRVTLSSVIRWTHYHIFLSYDSEWWVSEGQYIDNWFQYCNRPNDTRTWNSSCCSLRRFSRSSLESLLCPLQLVSGHEIFSQGNTGCFGNEDREHTPGVKNYSITWTQRKVIFLILR
jgi:hypothetical protein